MRYTRYNPRKRSNNSGLKFLTALVITVAIAGFIGLGLAKVIFKVLPMNNLAPILSGDSQTTNGTNVNNNSSNESNNTVVNTSFAAVQCGYFSTQAGADQTLAKLGDGYGAFVVPDGEKFRVIAGIYGSSDVQSAVDGLKNKGIDSIKLNISLNSSDEIQNQLAAISDGYIRLLSTTFDSDVKFINTDDFKDYVSKLDEITEGEGAEALQVLKSYIKDLPTEIKKEEVAKEMEYLYSLLIKYKQS